MNQDKAIILVTSSFAENEELLAWIKRYAQHSDDSFAYWDEFAFTTQLLPEYDAILVLNTPHDNISVLSDPGKIIAFMMEPGVKAEHPWMFKQLEQYTAVYSPVSGGSNSILSHGFMGWYFQKNLASLEQLSIPQKTKSVSCIVSGLKQLEGHRLRLKFVNQLRQQLPETDLFGKGTNYISDKMDGLLPYKYSIAIENSSIPFYFTEKINDCFLTYTVPLYYGCKNISKFFPGKSYIPIDINDADKAIRAIRSIVENDDWTARLEALKEARDLVLYKYQPLAGCAAAIRGLNNFSKQTIHLHPVHAGLKKRILSLFARVKKKITA